MPNIDIFISYRRRDSVYLANLIYYNLTQEGYHVFLDTETLSGGNFSDDIQTVIKRCKDFLLILPPNGLDRCNDSSDILRNEIELALRCNKRIIPILMPGFEYAKNLPESLSMLSLLNDIRIDENKLQADLKKIKQFLSSKPYKPIAELEALYQLLVDVENAASKKSAADTELRKAKEYGTPELNAYDKKYLDQINKELDENQPLKPEWKGFSDTIAYWGRRKEYKLSVKTYPEHREKIYAKYYADHKKHREEIRNADNMKQQSLLAEAQKKLDMANKEVNNARKAVQICDIVTADFKNYSAVTSLIEYLKEGRAKNLVEAIWLYEEYLQKQQELASIHEAISYLKSISRQVDDVKSDYYEIKNSEKETEKKLREIETMVKSIDSRIGSALSANYKSS